MLCHLSQLLQHPNGQIHSIGNAVPSCQQIFSLNQICQHWLCLLKRWKRHCLVGGSGRPPMTAKRNLVVGILDWLRTHVIKPRRNELRS